MATRTGATGRPRAARAEPNEKPDHAREAWALLTRLFKAEKGKHLAALELTMPQAQLLLNLDPDRPVPMNTLADTLGCDASNVTGLVDRLEARSLLERRADPDHPRGESGTVGGGRGGVLGGGVQPRGPAPPPPRRARPPHPETLAPGPP